ncbi:hypothetical protein ACM26V_10635 [Salipaludibacillus sp. HK11]|uniref:hypothetical protein n=1 Tax=Salipaludibacillus sp. HK11 TaxID=3394320 RepID=UPI0039FDE00A
MKKWMLLFIFIGLLLLTSCFSDSNHDSKMLNVMILSEIPLSYQSDFGPYIADLISEVNEDNLEINVELSQVSHDKLTIEIVASEVDVFVLDESLKHVMLDPYGLHPLDSLIDSFPENASYDEYIMSDENEENEHLYAVPLDNDSTLVQDLGLLLPSNLLAVVVKTSPHKEIGVKLLEEFL